MLALDEGGDESVDRIRDVMDLLWYRLSDDEVAALDARGMITPDRLNPVRLPLGESIYSSAQNVSDATSRIKRHGEVGVRISAQDWRGAA